MKKATLEALEASIAKWEKNARVRNLDNAQIYSDTCALCDLFYEDDCTGCPVQRKTGLKECSGTPWVDCCEIKNDDDIEGFRAAAREEVKFLKSLLPATTQEGSDNE